MREAEAFTPKGGSRGNLLRGIASEYMNTKLSGAPQFGTVVCKCNCKQEAMVLNIICIKPEHMNHTAHTRTNLQTHTSRGIKAYSFG